MVKPGSGGLAVLKHELELSQNHVPISTAGGPVFDNFPAGQVEHLAQGIIIGEAGLSDVRYFGSASAKKCAVQLALDELAAEKKME